MTAATPRVSVILTVFNGERYIKEAAESILAQTVSDFELLILDDGSTDKTLEIVSAYATADARVRVTSRPNTGVVAARNELILKARGPLLAMMDADDVAHPCRLQLQIDAFEEDRRLVAVGTCCEMVDPDGDLLGFASPPLVHEEIDAALMAAQPGVAMFQPSLMLRAGAVRSVGLYRDEASLAEDADLILRLAEVGRLANLPQRLLSYRVHLGSLSHVSTRRQAEVFRQVASEAARRRGLPTQSARPEAPLIDLATTAARTHVMWAWWAIDSGNLRTARKHAVKALRLSPFDLEAWRAVACALRGG